MPLLWRTRCSSNEEHRMTQHTQHHGTGDADVYTQVLERMNRFQEPEARSAIAAADRSFVWVWCGDVLHHIDPRGVALKEFLRVLGPGGTIIIKEPQVARALFLPGYPALKPQLQGAKIQ